MTELGERFRKVCKKGDITKFDSFHRKYCAMSDPPVCCGGSISDHDRTTDFHKDNFWRCGYAGAFEGNHTHIVNHLMNALGVNFCDAQYDALRNKSVNKEIIDLFNQDPMSFMDISDQSEPGHYNYIRCYLAACERGEVDMFKHLELDTQIKSEAEFFDKDPETKEYTTDLAKQGFEITCKKDHSELLSFLKKLYKEYAIKFVCNVCKKNVNGH